MDYKITFSGNYGASTQNYNTVSLSQGTTGTPFFGNSDEHNHACGLIIEATGEAENISGSGISLYNRTLIRNGSGGASPTLKTVNLYSPVPKIYYFLDSSGNRIDYINYSDGSLDPSTDLYIVSNVWQSGNNGFIKTNSGVTTGIAAILYIDPKEYIYIDDQSGTFSTTDYPLYKDSDNIYHENTGAELSNVTLLSPISRRFRQEDEDVFKKFSMRSHDASYDFPTVDSTDTRARNYQVMSGYQGNYQNDKAKGTRILYIQAPADYSSKTASSKHYSYNNAIEDFKTLDMLPTKKNPIILGSIDGEFEPNSTFCGVDETLFYANGSLYAVPQDFKVATYCRHGGAFVVDNKNYQPALKLGVLPSYTYKAITGYSGSQSRIAISTRDSSLTNPYIFDFHTYTTLTYNIIARNNNKSNEYTISQDNATDYGFTDYKQNTPISKTIQLEANIQCGNNMVITYGASSSQAPVSFNFQVSAHYNLFKNETIDADNAFSLDNWTDSSSYISYVSQTGVWLMQGSPNDFINDENSNFYYAMTDSVAMLILTQKVAVKLSGIAKTNLISYASLDIEGGGNRLTPTSMPTAYGASNDNQYYGGTDFRVKTRSTGTAKSDKSGIVVYGENEE